MGNKMNLEAAVCPCSEESQLHKVLARIQPVDQRNDSSSLFNSYGVASVLVDSSLHCKAKETSTNWSKSNRGLPDLLGLEHLTCQERLRDMGWFSLEEK